MKQAAHTDDDITRFRLRLNWSLVIFCLVTLVSVASAWGVTQLRLTQNEAEIGQNKKDIAIVRSQVSDQNLAIVNVASDVKVIRAILEERQKR